jgi:hypothetical protein
MSTSSVRSHLHEADSGAARGQEFLRWTALAFAVGFGIHGVDHVRRGMSAATTFVMIGGTVEALSVAIAVIMTLTRRAWAPQVAILVGFGSAIGSTYGHLLPTFWLGYQDSFISLPHVNVTSFSWLSLIAAMGTGIVFGFAGIQALLGRTRARA